MRLDQGPGPGFVLLVTALTVGAAWSAAQTKPLAPEVPERLQSQPVKAKPGTGPGFVVVDEQRPDGRAALQATDYAAEALPIPGLSALSGDPLRFALDALNGTVAPCEPCWTWRAHPRRLPADAPEDCERLPVWTERAVRLSRSRDRHRPRSATRSTSTTPGSPRRPWRCPAPSAGGV
ncbi:MAG: hypothetical protein H6741_33125 [Alphaproteobacteria bacterium]|nr:hypothetical protein [Alphaproteobacteria bacterium]